MDDLSILAPVILLFLLLVATVVIVILIYNYYSLKSRVSQELQKQTEIAYREAQKQFQQWREQEIERIRKEQLDIARREAEAQFEEWKKDYQEKIRQDAIQRSQSVIAGKVTEHIVPFLPGFIYNPKDVRFIGTPIDLIVFDGLNDGEVRQIVFIEIKTGKSPLNSKQRQLRRAVQNGIAVKREEIRPPMGSANHVDQPPAQPAD